MAVIDYNPHTKYEKFVDKLGEFPFIRIALFATISCVVFSLIGLGIISKILIWVIPLAIVGRILSYVLCFPQYPLSRFWVTSLCVGIEFGIAAAALGRFMYGAGEGLVVSVLGIVVGVVGLIATLGIFLGAIGFLIWVFGTLFSR